MFKLPYNSSDPSRQQGNVENYKQPIESVLIQGNSTRSEVFRAEQGVRQECILSSQLFNIHDKYIIREALEDWSGGISIGSRNISNLRYADDTTLLLAVNEEEMADLIYQVKTVSERLGLRINTVKTKVMVVDRTECLQSSTAVGENEKVSSFIYLVRLHSRGW